MNIDVVADDVQSLRTKLGELTYEDRDILIRALIGDDIDLPAGEIIAVGVSLEDYMERYAEDHCEWVEGYVIKMSPGSLKHNGIIYYLYDLLRIFFARRSIGRVVGQPFVMRLPAFPRRRREPDLFVVLKTNPSELKDTYMDGPADICIEIVSDESFERDHGEKFKEYEKGSVPEYWIIDPLRKEGRFYRRDEAGLYIHQAVDSQGNYFTPTLPKLAINIPTLWIDELPDPEAIVAAVKAMLESAS